MKKGSKNSFVASADLSCGSSGLGVNWLFIGKRTAVQAPGGSTQVFSLSESATIHPGIYSYACSAFDIHIGLP
jgi:hypothetical protein